MTSTTFSVPTISCQHCKAAIEGAVGELEGVSSVNVDIGKRHVSVLHDGSDLASIATAIEEAGYAVQATESSTPSGGC